MRRSVALCRASAGLVHTSTASHPLRPTDAPCHLRRLSFTSTPSVSSRTAQAPTRRQRRWNIGGTKSSSTLADREAKLGMFRPEGAEEGAPLDSADAISWAQDNAERIMAEHEEAPVRKQGAKGVVAESEDQMLRVALFGKESVGKSRLFNCFVDALDHSQRTDIPGVTSDTRTAEASLGRMYFTAIDTPGIKKNFIPPSVEMIAPSVDLALFVVDVRAGLDEHDLYVSRFLADLKIPTILVGNKSQHKSHTLSKNEEAALIKHGPPVYVSATMKSGLGKIQDLIAPMHAMREAERKRGEWALEDRVLEGDADAREELGEVRRLDTALRIVVTGPFNVGKSTLFNSMLGYDRCSVTPMPGTTRDTVFAKGSYRGKRIHVVDTPGMTNRLKDKFLNGDPKTKANVETEAVTHWMHSRSVEYATWANVILFVFDARAGLGRRDKNLVESLIANGRPVILVANKWDEVESKRETAEDIEERLRRTAELGHLTVVCVSAKNGTNLSLLMETVFDHWRRWHVRLNTGKLNIFWHKVQSTLYIPFLSPKARHLRQIATCPPTFVIFLSRTTLLRGPILRHMLNSIRKEFRLNGIPIRLIQRRKQPSVYKQLGYTEPERVYKKPSATMNAVWKKWEAGAYQGERDITVAHKKMSGPLTARATALSTPITVLRESRTSF